MKNRTLKLLLFSDLHASREAFSLFRLIFENEEVTGAVFAGDFVNMGEPLSYAEEVLKIVLNIKKPFLWVPGNNDFGRSYELFSSKIPSLEGRIVDLKEEISRLNKSMARDDNFPGYRFTGVGGSPDSWAGQYQGERSVLPDAVANTILVSHVPPPNLINLQPIDKEEKNSQPFNNLTMKQFNDAPLAHICGHIHNHWGIGYLGNTKVIKLASMESGHYAMMNPETLKVTFYKKSSSRMRGSTIANLFKLMEQ